MNSCIVLYNTGISIVGTDLSISFEANKTDDKIALTSHTDVVSAAIISGCATANVIAKCADNTTIEKRYRISWDNTLTGQELIDSVIIKDDDATNGCCESYGNCLTDLVGLTSIKGCTECKPFNNIPSYAYTSTSGYYLTDLVSFNDYFLTDCNGSSNWDILNKRIKRVATQDILADISACLGTYMGAVNTVTETNIGNATASVHINPSYNNEKYAGQSYHTKNTGAKYFIDSVKVIRPFGKNNIPFVGYAKLLFYLFKNDEPIYSFYVGGEGELYFNGKEAVEIDLSDENLSFTLDGSIYSFVWRTYDYLSGKELVPSNASLPIMHDGFPCKCGAHQLPPSWVCARKSEMNETTCTFNKFVAFGVKGNNIDTVSKWGPLPGRKAVQFAQTCGGLSVSISDGNADCSNEALICRAINANKDIKNLVAYMLLRKMAIKTSDLLLSGEVPSEYFQISMQQLSGITKVWLGEYDEKLNGTNKSKSICQMIRNYISTNLKSVCIDCSNNMLTRKRYNSI